LSLSGCNAESDTQETASLSIPTAKISIDTEVVFSYWEML